MAFGTKGDAFWRRVIWVKYRSKGGGWCSNYVPSPCGVSLWKSIRSGWSSFSCYIQLEMGQERNFGMSFGVGIVL